MTLNVWLIARREYVERIRTRGFIITTVMIPVLMVGFICGSLFLGPKASLDRHIAVVSTDVQLALDLQTELQREQQKDQLAADSQDSSSAPAKKPSHITVEAMDPSSSTRAVLNQELESDELDGYLWITPATHPGGRSTFEFTPRTSGDNAIKATLVTALDRVLLREQLSHRGIVAAEVNTMLQPVQIGTTQRIPHSDRISAQISVSVLFFIMYMVIMLYGMNVARSIIEEKTSRIFEVLLATVRPEAMMAGKILGVGAVGLTQVGIWLLGGLLIAETSAAVHLGGSSIHVALTLTQVFFFFVYFILGYLFYSSIAAALGAMTNSEQELQQLNMFLMLPLLVCFVMLGTLLTAPDSPLARAMALFPPFTPLLMYMRISLGNPAAWEVILSIVLTTASICGTVWIASRIYRVGILMYGKRPSIPEVFRWLRYS